MPAAAPAPGRALGRLAGVSEQTRQLATSGIFVRVLVVLLAIDALLITLHVLTILLRLFEIPVPVLDSEMVAITEDGGYAEIFCYLKSIVITFSLLICYFRERAPVFLALSFAFVVIMLDDSLQIHERFGIRLMAALALEPLAGLRARDLGELMVWLALGIVVVTPLAISFLRSDELGRNIALIFLGLLAVLIFCAIGVGMLHVALGGLFRGADHLWALLEDGGEMVMLSVIAAAAVAVAWCGSSRLARPGACSARPLP